MATSTIETLPEELLLTIFQYLETAPPSELKLRQEPSLDLTSSETHILKNISYVSKRWRRIALPSLFRYARLRIDIEPDSEWALCPYCDGSFPTGQTTDVDSYHIDLMRTLHEKLNSRLESTNSEQPSTDLLTAMKQATRSDQGGTEVWASRFYHVLKDFMIFIQAQNLTSSVQSFVLLSDKMEGKKPDRFPHRAGPREWRYIAAAAFWAHFLSIIDPKRIVVIAPPVELGFLTNASIDTFGDWAFTDMEFHILELRQPHSNGRDISQTVEIEELDPFSPRHPGLAPSSLLYLRPWSHVSLNEGSFLKAYGTYEYFERGPPSLVHSIKQCLSPLSYQGPSHNRFRAIPSIRSFTYTAIFPFANHADFIEILPQLEVLDVQFAPDPQSGILDDKARTGKAELQDCWQELVSAYHDIVGSLATMNISEARLPNLRKFICRDVMIPALKTELDDIFTPLCLPVWVEGLDGVDGHFTRQTMSAQIHETGSEG